MVAATLPPIKKKDLKFHHFSSSKYSNLMIWIIKIRNLDAPVLAEGVWEMRAAAAAEKEIIIVI